METLSRTRCLSCSCLDRKFNLRSESKEYKNRRQASTPDARGAKRRNDPRSPVSTGEDRKKRSGFSSRRRSRCVCGCDIESERCRERWRERILTQFLTLVVPGTPYFRVVFFCSHSPHGFGVSFVYFKKDLTRCPPWCRNNT